MLSRFLSRSLRCVLIAASSAQRQLMWTVLKELGFQNVVSLPDIKSAVKTMETEHIDWIITPVADNHDTNVLALLDLINSEHCLNGIHVSIIRNQDDDLLPAAFAAGALSCHKFEPSRDSCLREFNALLTRIIKTGQDPIVVAATYLGDILIAAAKYEELKNFYKRILDRMEYSEYLQILNAITQLNTGETQKGLATLYRLEITSTDHRQKVAEVIANYYGAYRPPKTEDILNEQYGNYSVLLVNSEEKENDIIKTALRKLGFHNIFCHSDPAEALTWLTKNPKPNLVIAGWNLPRSSNAVFLNNARKRLGGDVPLIVIHEKLGERDALLIHELDASAILPKPLQESQLIKEIICVLDQRQQPTDFQRIKNKLKAASSSKNAKAIETLTKQFMEHPQISEGEKLLIEGVLAYDAGCFIHAKKHSLNALHSGCNQLEGMELLGKSLKQLRMFDAAARCLENVTFLSPHNVSHLCNLAECQLEQDNDQAYNALMDAAHKLDSEATDIVELKAKAALKRGDTAEAKNLLKKLSSYNEVMAFMNNRAVNLIRLGRFEEGFGLYIKALESLPDNDPILHATINYNLGLGYVRAGLLQYAANCLDKISIPHKSDLFSKISSLKTRIKKSMETNTPIKISADVTRSENEEQEILRQIVGLTPKEDEESDEKRMNGLNGIYTTNLASDKVGAATNKKLFFIERGVVVKTDRGLIIKKDEKIPA